MSALRGFLIVSVSFRLWVRVWVGKVLLKQVFYKIFSRQRGSASNFRCSKIEPHKQRKASLSGIFEIVFLKRIIYNGIINTIFKFRIL